MKVDQTSAEQDIEYIQSYIPDVYRSHKQFQNCARYVKTKKYGLAIKSLVLLAEETGHYFSTPYWKALLEAAKRLDLPEQESLCRLQIERNAENLNTNLPFGWTCSKTDESHFDVYIASKVKEKWDQERWESDKVGELVDVEGFHVKIYGKSGCIYYAKEGKVAEVPWSEGIVEWTSSSKRWIYPYNQEMTPLEYLELSKSIKEFTSKNNMEMM